jgi:hypothetical protein
MKIRLAIRSSVFDKASRKVSRGSFVERGIAVTNKFAFLLGPM